MTQLLTILAALAAVYALMIVGVWAYARSLAEPATLRDAARFGPDLLGLIRKLIASGALSRRGRAALILLAGYLVLPIDLIPDVVPLIGWADDVVIVVLVLRGVVRHAGSELIRSNWSGSAAGLSVLLRLLRAT
jgi:uncharacterized membrane protein YkvA (DUF1232 family)